MAEEAQAFYGGPVGILVNNAGYFYDVSPLIRMSDEQINHTIDVNLKGTMYMSREICRRLTDAGLPGRVVNITSGPIPAGWISVITAPVRPAYWVLQGQWPWNWPQPILM